MGIRPEKMVRIRIIGSNQRKDQIISALHDAGVIQLEPVSQDLAKMLGNARPSELYRKINTLLQRFRGYEAMLPHREVRERRTFSSVDELVNEASKIDIENHLKSLKDQETDLLARLKEAESRLQIISKLRGLKYDLSIFNGSQIMSYLVTDRPDDSSLEELKNKIPDSTIISINDNTHIISIPTGRDSDLARAANDMSFTIVHIPLMSGTPEEAEAYLREKMDEDRIALENIRRELEHLSQDYFTSVVQIREQLDIENRKLEVSERLASTQDTFVMEGWVPEKYFNAAVKLVEKAAEGRVIVGQIETKDSPPTLLENPRKFRIFEFFVRFYSLPQEFEFDPTMIFGIIFPIFFGIMVGDWGYGLVILLLAIWMVRKLQRPGSRTILPKSLTRFAMTIFGRNPLLILGKTLIPASIMAIAVGLLFNNFFGFPILPITVFQTSTGFSGAHIGGFPPTPIVIFSVSLMIPKLLLFSGYVGLAMVSFGLILGMVNEATLGHRRGVAGKVGWLMMAWGIAIFGLNLIHQHSGISLNIHTNPEGVLSIAAFVAGIIIVGVSEGTKGAVEIPSIISHILSYTRILGILLASVILAQVIDLIFMKGVMKSPLFAIIGIIILVFGQLFNLVIAVFEPGIQGARLLYVEFFSKFYYGNGRPFRPFKTDRKYTNPSFKIERDQE
ncbi:MAG: V-type ATP synthase subunit I [Candidatus Thermoplasmatota archaeon]|nr:V-type ATP synthase subunit I [Candidatus Thermoplasmatota archaeon]